MKNSTFDLEQFLPYRLAVTSNNVSVDFAKLYRKSHELDRAEWRIICHLSQFDESDALSIRDLEQLAHLEKSKVSRAVKRLEGRGIVSKKQNDGDARLLKIMLTPQGREIFAELVPIAQGFQSNLMAKLEPNEREQLLQILKKLT